MSNLKRKPTPDVQTDWVEAPVQYLADLSIKPVTYNPPNGTGVPRRIGNYRDFPVHIHDARLVLRNLSLDRQAFILTHHDTAVRDFYDKEEVRTAYEPQTYERLVRLKERYDPENVFRCNQNIAPRAAMPARVE